MFNLPFKFRDVIHSFIEFPNNNLGKTAIKIIQTQSYQKLRRLSQLGMAKFVYPCAEHSRFSHSMGAFTLSQKVIFVLNNKGKLIDITEPEKDATCLAALLHDIGHCMFSHASENMWNFKHEEQTYKIVQNDPEISTILSQYPSTTDFKQLIIDILKGENLTNNKLFLHDIVSSQLDVDRMDYILRDAHMTGVKYGSYDLKWILEHLNVGEFNGRYRLVIEKKALDAVEQYLTARFYMYRNVYEHKTARIFEIMLKAFVKEIKKLDNDLLIKHDLLWLKEPNFDDLSEYNKLDDFKMWEAIKLISTNEDFEGYVKILAKDFLTGRRWNIERNNIHMKSNAKGFVNDMYYTKVKPSKFYDQDPDKEIVVLNPDGTTKLLSEIGRFISINKKREPEEKFIIRR
jgi:hypothetical protein